MTPQQAQELQKARILATYQQPVEFKKSEDSNDLEKSHAAQIGEIHEWDGKKYKKQANGKWLEVSEKGLTKKGHEDKSTKYYKSPSTVGSDLGYEHSQIAKKLSDKEHSDEEVGLGSSKYKKGEAQRLSKLVKTNPEEAYKEAKEYSDLYQEMLDKDPEAKKFGEPVKEIKAEYDSVMKEAEEAKSKK